MWQCYYCRSPLPPEVQQRNRLCPNCGSDIHCCKNCVHFDESSTSHCREPDSPWIRDRCSQNSCTYFEFNAQAQSAQNSRTSEEAELAKKAFRALFREA